MTVATWTVLLMLGALRVGNGPSDPRDLGLGPADEPMSPADELALAGNTSLEAHGLASERLARVNFRRKVRLAQYDVLSPLSWWLRTNATALAAAYPFVLADDDRRVTLAWAWSAMRVCVSAAAASGDRSEAPLANVTLGRAAVRAAARATDSIVRAPRVLLWPLSERAAHNYGHLFNALIIVFAAARDAGFVRPSDAASDAASGTGARGWRFDSDVAVVVDSSGARQLLPRFEAIARVFFPTLRPLFDDRRAATERCARLPETVYGGGAAGMGNLWDYFSDAGLRLRPTGEPLSPRLPPRRWRAGEIVPAFQQYARAVLGAPLYRPRPTPAGRQRMRVLVEQRRSIGASGEGRASRHISNMDELVALGAELDASSAAFSVEVRAIEFGALPVRIAAALVSGAAALVGVEGSGLANAVFLPPGAALIVIKPPPQCHSDAYDSNDAHTLADRRDSDRAPHSNGQMFGYYGSFEKLALALEGPIHLLPLCVGREDVRLRWANSRLTRKFVERGWVDKYGAPLLTARSYASGSKLMRHMWYLNAVKSLRVEPELFRGALHALHTIWGAAHLRWPLNTDGADRDVR